MENIIEKYLNVRRETRNQADYLLNQIDSKRIKNAAKYLDMYKKNTILFHTETEKEIFPDFLLHDFAIAQIFS